MTQADRIRQFALDHLVRPARTAGRIEIVIRPGDIHSEMRLSNAMPAVCSAIGSKKFEELARVTAVKHTGRQTALTSISILASEVSQVSEVRLSPPGPLLGAADPPARESGDLDLANSIALISCVKSKRSGPAPARSLYTSPWFQKTRDIVERSGARWFILSAMYGLVAPATEIAPYDHTLNSIGIVERRLWAKGVLGKLLPEIRDERRIVMFAGDRYREFLVELLERHGLEVEVPMANLRRGEQQAWLSRHE